MEGDDDCSPPNYEDVQFNATGKFSQNYDSLVEKLDGLQDMVEKLRSAASDLAKQRDGLTKTLTDISEETNRSLLTAGHKEELTATVERVMSRLLTVEIKVEIPRNSEQQQAYNKVKQLLSQLQNRVNSGLEDYKKVLQSYANACSSEQGGPVDSNFQQFILACTIDDQKQVRKVLTNWINVYHELHEQWIAACKDNIQAL